MASTPDSAPRPGGRRDQRRNHERLLQAAVEVFDEQGVAAPLKDVAVRADVSIASLYRHFAGRDALLIAVYEEQVSAVERAAIAILESSEGSPQHRLDAYLEGLTTAFMRHPCYPALAARGLALHPARTVDPRLEELLEELRAAAEADGALAADVTANDLVMVPTALVSLVGFDQIGLPGVWRRQLAIARRGLRPEAAADPLPSVLPEA
ncbi:TetR/AcrR family transcriptional regulator [Leucobacter weissii]|uniref:TetR/AcrR family transcriptional regulator n=1 Tax=Leucobacter weissii TaxID=1983706 RepID=A0A939MTC5_9MICO|nr:TetR/AcrR family transcriptional regulator [Leucobacter weissii]MBO1902614.1 TetR/AcrR family transcriptional regulator [Leucobacter weissii]